METAYNKCTPFLKKEEKMKKYFHNTKAFLLFVSPALIVYVFIVIFPIIQSILYSFYDWNGVTEMKFIGVGNYKKMLFGDSTFWITVKNNITYMLINVVIQLGLGMLVALLLEKIEHGKNFFKTLYFAPAVISSVAICQVFGKALSTQPMGFFNELLQKIGLDVLVKPWISDVSGALPAVSVIEAYRYVGLYMIILYSALMSVNKDLIEAATIDGAKGFKLFWKIKFPQIKGVFGVAFVMIVNGTMKGFDIPYILTKGGPANRSELVATYMYKNAFNAGKFGYGSAIAVFIALECLIIFMFLKNAYLKEDDD